MRVACVLAAHLPVQLERSDPSLTKAPLIVGGHPWDDGAVLDCCARAEARGVGPGMRLARAEKLCPAAHFVPAREDLYQAAHDALVAAVKRFTPTVETARLGLLYAEVTGLKRFGSERDLASQVVREAHDNTYLPNLRVGIAGGKFAAEQAARAARPGGGCVVDPGGDRTFLAPLPLSVLPADAEMERRLRLLGVRTLGALAALPRLAVVRQFGPHAGPFHDLACGLDPRPARPDAPPLRLTRAHTFDEPVSSREPLLAHAGRIAAELAGALAQGGHQAEGLRLVLEQESSVLRETGAPVKPPSNDADKLARLAARLLGELKFSAPVAALSLSVYPVRPFHLGATQLALWTPPQDEKRNRLQEALRELRERFGEFIIVVAALVKSPPPQPVQVTADLTGMPRALVWRDRIREVRLIYEAWRERCRWWSLPVERDYFRLETADGLVRVVFRDLRTDRWLMERRRV